MGLGFMLVGASLCSLAPSWSLLDQQLAHSGLSSPSLTSHGAIGARWYEFYGQEYVLAELLIVWE